jgi:hypothetical protein
MNMKDIISYAEELRRFTAAIFQQFSKLTMPRRYFGGFYQTGLKLL